MQPATLPLDFYRGDSQRLQVRLWQGPGVPYDLTGVTAKSEIRDRPAGPCITEMACVITLPNIIDVYLAATDSHKLPPKGAWDLQLTYASGDVKTPLAGPVTVTTDVTDSTP
jgi:hypothetical protein